MPKQVDREKVIIGMSGLVRALEETGERSGALTLRLDDAERAIRSVFPQTVGRGAILDAADIKVLLGRAETAGRAVGLYLGSPSEANGRLVLGTDTDRALLVFEAISYGHVRATAYAWRTAPDAPVEKEVLGYTTGAERKEPAEIISDFFAFVARMWPLRAA